MADMVLRFFGTRVGLGIIVVLEWFVLAFTLPRVMEGQHGILYFATFIGLAGVLFLFNYRFWRWLQRMSDAGR